MKIRLLLCIACIGSVGYTLIPRSSVADQPSRNEPTKEAVQRTRQTIMMLDDIYKTTVVLITDKYVNAEDDFPAGSAAIALFDSITKKGTHKVRLIDATGSPYDDANVANDDFEKEAIQRLKKGEKTVEKIINTDGKDYLRVLTPVPVVMPKCTMCHPVYEQAKPDEPIGAISYTMEIGS